MMLHNVNNNQV